MAMQTCPSCGNPIRATARFCPNCRYQLVGAPQPNVTPPPITCPKCNTQNRANAKFCANCRAPLQLPQPPPVPPLGQPQVQQPVPPRPMPIPPTPPQQLRPAPASPRLQMRYIYATLAALLTLCLCISTSSVFVYEMTNPTPTRTVSATATPLPPTSTPTNTLTPTITLTPTPLPMPTMPMAATVPVATRPPTPTPDYPGPVIDFRVNGVGRFGVFTTIGDPKRSDDDNKRLTYMTAGETSNTRIFVDGGMPIFGGNEGTLVTLARKEGAVTVTEWEHHKIFIAQRLSIVQGPSTNRFDTLKIEYILENRDGVAHQVGLRMMIDTLIGNNDGVPFSVPGQQGIVNRAIDLRGKAIPDFFQVLENPSMTNPGVVINVTLSGRDATPPERVLITGWPGGEAPWDYLANVGGVDAPLGRGGQAGGGGDSAVGLFYPIKIIAPAEQYHIVAYYGLGDITKPVNTPVPNSPALGLSISANQVEQGASFWILARVDNPQAGMQVTLVLPPELELLDGQITQAITPETNASFTTRSWLVRAKTPGMGVKIAVKLTPNNLSEERTLDIIALPTPTPTITPSITPTRGATLTPTPTATSTRSVIR